MTYLLETPTINLLSVTANTTAVIPAGYAIIQLIAENTTANTVTGGNIIGTTNGGTEVSSTFTVPPNSIMTQNASSFAKTAFSTTVDTTIYINAAVSWNSASINFYIGLRKFV